VIGEHDERGQTDTEHERNDRLLKQADRFRRDDVLSLCLVEVLRFGLEQRPEQVLARHRLHRLDALDGIHQASRETHVVRGLSRARRSTHRHEDTECAEEECARHQGGDGNLP
jgi:hypothetical protein